MSDVAMLAGVSAQTVSRVANGHTTVKESNRQRVLAAMKQLGYRPNSAARALRRGEFRTIGVIILSLSSTGNVRILEAIATAAARESYAVTLLPVSAPTEREVRGAFTRFSESAVDGVIAVMGAELLDSPTVSLPPNVQVAVSDAHAGDRYSVVDTDQVNGTREAVRHLLDLGHRTVWHLAGPEESFAARRRAAAWQATLAEAEREIPPLVHGDWSAESGYRAGLRLAAESGCTAVFTANDQMALGLLRALNETGREVPGDVSVVGFDDIPETVSFLPPLTTVRQDFATLGRLLVEGVLRRLRTDSVEPGITLVPTHLVVRASTAPPGVPEGARPAGWHG
ncbi:LacI family DNA-binding transcriptional regulator [Streptomyces johnsoniae]|uniref:LacI family DNA-binding transcriptional regulator n=1 Tax=Streptomyces johnsoniae TaxID=3075532 RepID=A0ABU2SDF6_9ACTN|nr:LacI family DNA-binding transcriptional regulator [Streptomyces sp. DSM 41886]MDT0446701.1 LacI family DNA-binding transcriptional regulator [Streptomyces sp. DSM 41886]